MNPGTKFILGVAGASLMFVGSLHAASTGGRIVFETAEKLKKKIYSKFQVAVPYAVEKLVFKEPDLNTVVSDASEKYGIPTILIHAVMQVESPGKNTTRFEPKKYEQDTKAQNEFTRIMKNSSHGKMQVMGFNAESCGITWQELYQPQKGIDCGVKILRNCYQRATGRTESEKLTQALGCYNGDPVRYPEKVKSALIDKLIETKELVVAMNGKGELNSGKKG